MSTFFKALEQAELDRALGERARTNGKSGEAHAADASAPAPAAAPPSAGAATAVAEPAVAAVAPPAPPRAARPARATEPERPWAAVDAQMVSLLRPASAEAEQYRALRHTVEHLARAQGLTVLAVSSPGQGDGKTLTAINLAGALAQAPEARVLLVDADLRRPAVGERLGLAAQAAPGLVDAILDPTLPLDAVIRLRPPYNLSVLPAGSGPNAPYEVLQSPRLGELLAEARRRFTFVIVDTPPIVSVPDCRVIGASVDGFIVVVAADRTPRRLVEEALDLMDPAKVVGLVFNDAVAPVPAAAYAGSARSGGGPRPPAL